MNGRKTGRTAIIIPALYALGGLFSCLFAGDTGTTGGVSAGGLISGDNRMAGSLQGIGGPFSKWGGESIRNSGSGFVYAAAGRTGATDKRPEFARKSPDPDKPPIADKVSFSQSQPETKVSIDDIRSISFGMETADAAPGSGFSVKSAKADVAANKVSDFRPGGNDEIKYPEVEDGVDLYYQARGNRLEEDIVLKKPPKKNTFNFKLNARGLTAIPQGDGTIQFRDNQTGQVLFYFDKPFMVDSAGVKSEDVRLKLENPGKLVVEADAGWLNDAARKYPVVIDPTLVIVSYFSGAQSINYRNDRILRDGQGNLYILALSTAPVFFNLILRKSGDNGKIWDPPVILNPVGTWSYAPLVVDNANKLHIVYGMTDAAGNYLYYTNNIAGSWTAPALINSNTNYFAVSPPSIDLAVDSPGNLHLVWVHQDGTLYYAQKPVGGAWQAPFALASNVTHAAIKADNQNNLHVVATKTSIATPSSGYALYLKRQSGSWSSAEVIFSSSCRNPSLALDSKNQPYVALGEDFSTHSVVYTAKSQTGWSSPLFFEGSAGDPEVIVGIDGNDGAHLLWGPGGIVSSYSDKLKMASNINGTWTTVSTIDLKGNIVISLDAIMDKRINSWDIVFRHGLNYGLGSPSPISYLSLPTSVSYPRPPSGLSAAVLPPQRVKLDWQASPSAGIAAYDVYWDSGTGIIDYSVLFASAAAADLSFATQSLSTGTYRFALRARGQVQPGWTMESLNENLAVSVVVSSVPAPAAAAAVIKVPQSGRRIAGNRVTVMAELVQGSPGAVRQVLFQYRSTASTTAVWADMTSANPEHPNPDADSPYFIHWDVTGFAPGDYELRGVAADISGNADPNPPTVMITVDNTNPDTEEKAVGGIFQKREVVFNTIPQTLKAGDLATNSITQVALPAGAVTSSSTMLKVVVNPAGVPGPASGLTPCSQAREITLENGQTMLNSPATLSLQYQDGDNDGLVDGTLARADKLAIYAYDPASGQWRKESASSIDQIGKTVIAQTAHFSLFGLFAPAAADLSDVLVYPVPWVPNDGNPDNGKPYNSADPASGIVFDNLTQSARIQIYTITGELVWEKVTDASSGKLQWDGKNNSGRNAASGGYFAVITDTADGSKITRKIAVVR